MLGALADLFVGEAAEGVGHHLVVRVEMSWPPETPLHVVVERRQECGRAVGSDERTGDVEGGRVDAPLGLAPPCPRGNLERSLGHEGAGDAGFERAFVAVVEDCTGVLDGRGGVGDVVDDLLVGIDDRIGASAVDHSGQVAKGGVDDGTAGVDDGRSGSEILCRHGPPT